MPNESTSGFTDEQLQQIAQIVQQANQSSTDSAVGQVAEVVSSAQGAIVQSVPSAVSSALDSRSGAQLVTVSDEQWGFVSDSYRLQNSVLLFVVLLVSAIIGVLFFELFSKGFRRD